MLLIVWQACRLLGPLITGLCPVRKDYRGHHPGDLILHNFLLHRNRRTPLLHLHPLEIPPTNFLECGWAKWTSNHTAGFAKKNCGMVHGGPKVMKDQVLMNPRVHELKPFCLQSFHQTTNDQQDRVYRDSSLAIAAAQKIYWFMFAMVATFLNGLVWSHIYICGFLSTYIYICGFVSRRLIHRLGQVNLLPWFSGQVGSTVLGLEGWLSGTWYFWTFYFTILTTILWIFSLSYLNFHHHSHSLSFIFLPSLTKKTKYACYWSHDVAKHNIQLQRTTRCQGHSSLDAPSELNPPQRIPSPLLLHY